MLMHRNTLQVVQQTVCSGWTHGDRHPNRPPQTQLSGDSLHNSSGLVVSLLRSHAQTRWVKNGTQTRWKTAELSLCMRNKIPELIHPSQAHQHQGAPSVQARPCLEQDFQGMVTFLGENSSLDTTWASFCPSNNHKKWLHWKVFKTGCSHGNLSSYFHRDTLILHWILSKKPTPYLELKKSHTL